MLRASVAALALGVCALLLASCTTPGQRFQGAAAALGLQATVTTPNALPLMVFRRDGSGPVQDLHVYLDGDGTPLDARGRPSRDPTTRKRLVLALLAADTTPSVLLGRPCYYLVAAACDPRLWTSARYGHEVLDALHAALVVLLAEYPRAHVTLIGYSGGGTLAMLLAPRLPRVTRVLTVAANLDVTAWARHHGHAPLTASLDPATAPALPATIAQFHWFGAEDDNVPAALMRASLARQPQGHVEVLAGHDHECCWAEIWPQLLATANAKH